ncbi:MAG: DUF389 domain-containing protein [Bacteroidales bacterium]|nr:DUF389 domain-containing protein [Bacteroidales bacterium]
MKQNVKQQIINTLRRLFDLSLDKEEEQAVAESIESGVQFRGAQLWILILAILIASLGLNVNSTAVIIGAMLISPLMGPIIGAGFGIGIGDVTLLKRSLRNLGAATVISVITATIYFLLSPFGEAQSELLARTSPTLYDVLIAFCGGAAGFIAISTKGKGNVIPGVAIATALMPPLCTAGFGLASGNLRYFMGAVYLFFINSVFICLSTYLGTRLLKFHRLQVIDPVRRRKVSRYIAIAVTVTMIPAAVMTVSIVRQSIFNRNVSNFIKSEASLNGTEIISNEVDGDSHTLRLVAVGREIPAARIAEMEQNLGHYHLGAYSLQVIQGTLNDSIVGSLNLYNERYTQTIQDQQLTITNLQHQLDSYTELRQLSPRLLREAQTILSAVEAIGIAPVNMATDSASISITAAIVSLASNHHLSPNETLQLDTWLKARLETDSVMLLITGSGSQVQNVPAGGGKR